MFRAARFLPGLCLASLLLVGMGYIPRADVAAESPVPAPAATEAFTKQIQPLLAKYCIDCHSGDKPEADLALDKLTKSLKIAADRRQWEHVLENISSQTMPPQDEPAPTAEERQAIVHWLHGEFDRIDAQGSKDPGHVTIRRLNRIEYNHTIRDLLGVDFRPATDFPLDDVGYGFDNIGDVLSLSPMLMEKYLAAAEKITSKAIVTDLDERQGTLRFEAEKMQSAKSINRADGKVFIFITNGERSATLDCPTAGEYRFRIRAYGDQAGGDPVRMTLSIDDKVVQQFDVRAVENRPKDYDAVLPLPSGKHRVAVAFINDYYEPKAENPQDRDSNLYVDYVEVQAPEHVMLNPLPESHQRIIVRQPTAGDDEACIREIMSRFASRAFRRPVRPNEVERLVRLVRQVQADGESFETAIQVGVQAVLVSPHFLFRVELDDGYRGPATTAASQGSDIETVYIGDYALASRLSYFLWSSMPDDELFARAADGTLRKPEVLAAQVRRMIRDPRSKALVDNFAGQWLQFRNLNQVFPNEKVFKTFNKQLRDAMGTETAMCFEAVMRDDRSVLDLIDADYTFLNERLAKHYGLENVKGGNFRRVTLDDPNRGGVITQASMLTITSHPTRTSPVKRGKWILENILGLAPPEPPPNVPQLEENRKAVEKASLRERLELHRADATCASCHARMDPLGFGLENFNAIGAWRTEDEKFPIDASGAMPDGTQFSGPAELKQYLKGRPDDFARCLTEKLLTYALGRGLNYDDRPTTKGIVTALGKNEYRFSVLVTEIVSSQPFQMKRAPREERHE